jgi:isopentenyl-diphosphate Delta-isomerase
MFKDAESPSGKDKALKYTPWFRLICEGMLFEWWEALKKGELAKYVDEQDIRRM